MSSLVPSPVRRDYIAIVIVITIIVIIIIILFIIIRSHFWLKYYGTTHKSLQVEFMFHHDAASQLVFQCHGRCLRTLSAQLGTHYNGLRQAATVAYKQGLLPAHLRTKLHRLDHSFALIRHITQASSDAFVNSIHSHLNAHAVQHVEHFDLASSSDETLPPDDAASHATQTEHQDNGVVVITAPEELLMTVQAQALSNLHADLQARGAAIAAAVSAPLPACAPPTSQTHAACSPPVAGYTFIPDFSDWRPPDIDQHLPLVQDSLDTVSRLLVQDSSSDDKTSVLKLPEPSTALPSLNVALSDDDAHSIHIIRTTMVRLLVAWNAWRRDILNEFNASDDSWWTSSIVESLDDLIAIHDTHNGWFLSRVELVTFFAGRILPGADAGPAHRDAVSSWLADFGFPESHARVHALQVALRRINDFIT